MTYSFVYIWTIGFLPLLYSIIKSTDLIMMKQKKYRNFVIKDLIRTCSVCFLMMLPIFIMPQYNKPYLIFVATIFVPLLVIELGHIHQFGIRIGLNTFFTIFASNIKETKECLLQTFTLPIMTMFILLWAGFFYFAFNAPTPSLLKNQQIALSIMAIILALPFIRNLFLKWPKFKDSYVLNPYSGFLYHLYTYHQNQKLLKDAIKKQEGKLAEVTSLVAKDVPECYVIVIGESANRNHLSLYGYPRNTSEFLEKEKDDLLIFKNVVSPFAQTLPVLERLLTFADNKNPENLYKKGSIIQFFKNAGFKTYWLSNQYALDERDLGVTAIAGQADVYKSYNMGSMKRFEKTSFDEALLPDIEKIIQDFSVTKKIVFINIIGSHSAYINRYPSSFSVYGGTMPHKQLKEAAWEAVNTYDNSIRYTDFVISKILKYVQEQDSLSYFHYLSDHGEDCFDTTTTKSLGHSELANAPMTEIPCIFWLSEKLKKARPDLEKNAKQNLDKAYNTNDWIHTIINASSLSSQDCDKSKSLL